MPRQARIVVAGRPHHVIQRGNNRQDVFVADDDRRVYLELLREQADRYGLVVEGYCLMDNHMHLVATPPVEEALALAVGRTHFWYAQYFNRVHRRDGHLWQGRFHSCALDTEHFWTAMKYIERHPVRAKLCRKPWRYEWSSAAAHVGEPTKADVLDLAAWHKRVSADQWRRELDTGLEDELIETLRVRTQTGRPWGNDAFLNKLERRLGRRVRALPIGRPRKTAQKKVVVNVKKRKK